MSGINTEDITKNKLIAELKFISRLCNGKMSTKAVLVIGNLFVMLVGGESEHTI